jgi:hypothetical protein
MRSDIRTGIVVAGLLAALAAGEAWSRDRKKPSPPSKETTGSLLRKDLLAMPPAEAAAPLRDIFRPGSGSLREPVESIEAHRATPSGQSGNAAPGSMVTPSLSFVLDYIGYIRSSHKIIALIILDGQARAVVEGEEILPGVKVSKVGPEFLEVSGPSAGKMKFSRQGEES